MNKIPLREIRESLMLSKAELARRANISPITITRIEQGMSCTMETKQKIIVALGYKISDEIGTIVSSIIDKRDKRFGFDRRQFSYDEYIPERRSGEDRRRELDKRKKIRISKQ